MSLALVLLVLCPGLSCFGHLTPETQGTRAGTTAHPRADFVHESNPKGGAGEDTASSQHSSKGRAGVTGRGSPEVGTCFSASLAVEAVAGSTGLQAHHHFLGPLGSGSSASLL